MNLKSIYFLILNLPKIKKHKRIDNKKLSKIEHQKAQILETD